MLNLSSVVKYALMKTPVVKINIKDGWLRHDVVSLLEGSSNIGIELGVAKGIYAKRIVDSKKFKRFYGVDVYGDTHNTEEYCEALQYIGFDNPKYCLLRMDFDSALNLFEDEYFDFIYIDGFAHTGEEGGKTLIQWIRKLKPGGILAGDDYHDDWPLVKWAVNDLVEQLDADLYITGGIEHEAYCKYPTWFITKPDIVDELEINSDLYRIAMSEKKRIHSLRVGIRGKIKKITMLLLTLTGLKTSVKKLAHKLECFR